MAICDLSSRNPNVLFELGLRQAFDKPTVLVQEVGTPRIFDIAPLRYTEYRKELRYREVLEDQKLIAEAITATKQASANGEGFNSLVNILSLSGPASLKEVNEADSSRMLQLVRAEMSEMRSDFRRTMHLLEVYREKEYISRPLSANFSRRLREIHGYIKKADYLMEDGAPKEVIIREINRAQEHLIRFLEGEAPLKYQKEAKHLRKLPRQVDSSKVEYLAFCNTSAGVIPPRLS